MTLTDMSNLIVSQIWLATAVITDSGWALAAGITWVLAYVVQVVARKLSEEVQL